MIEIGAKTRLRPAPSIYARPFGEELVLLEFAQGEYYALDEIGARIWRMLEAGTEVGTIAVEIATIYAVDESDALADIILLVGDLRTRALVEIV